MKMLVNSVVENIQQEILNLNTKVGFIQMPYKVKRY